MDSCFSGAITRDDMARMIARYDPELEEMKKALEKLRLEMETGAEADERNRIRQELRALLTFERESEVLKGALLSQILVFKDRHMELYLSHLSRCFLFRD